MPRGESRIFINVFGPRRGAPPRFSELLFATPARFADVGVVTLKYGRENDSR
jgi:hypothetical protein